jgi:hypothetical protein
MSRALPWSLACLVLAGPLLAQQDPAPGLLDTLPPVGYGTLGQGDVALRLSTELYDIQIMPLHEGIIRLMAPDTYASFHRLLESRAPELAESAARFGVRDPTYFLVTFFGRQQNARFSPDLLTVTSQNQVFRPVSILPLTPLWSGQQLNQRETARAIYMFADGIRLENELTVSYDRFATSAWATIIRTLDREWSSVQARAARENP